VLPALAGSLWTLPRATGIRRRCALSNVAGNSFGAQVQQLLGRPVMSSPRDRPRGAGDLIRD
jgi:hypothetical protein